MPLPTPSAANTPAYTIDYVRESTLYNPLAGVAFVRVAEQGVGPALLVINGLTRPVESWQALADALPDRHVIAFDAPGIGRSPRPLLPLTIHMLAELASVVLDTFDLAAADVLGYSHGGAVAQQLALDSPERVRHLILAATTPGLGAPVGDLAALASTTSDPSWPSSDPLGVTWRLAALAAWTSLPVLAQIPHPTLVVSGARDKVVPAATAALLTSGIPGAKAVVLDTDHDLQTPEASAQLAAVLERFLTA